MATILDENVRKLVDKANFAHLATIMEDGSPQVAPVWADIRTYVPMVLGQGNPIAVCCTDGFRPVFFKVERTEL